MTDRYESRLTYPTFVMMPNEKAMLMLYRDGTHNKGIAWLKEYDESTQSWLDLEPGVLSGVAHQPWTSNAYWNHPTIGRDGSLHLSFVWRTHSLGSEKRINNINIDYACSPDQGHNWYSSRGVKFQLPITQVNSETVLPISPGSNFINQSIMTIDTLGFPHIVFIRMTRTMLFSINIYGSMVESGATILSHNEQKSSFSRVMERCKFQLADRKYTHVE